MTTFNPTPRRLIHDPKVPTEAEFNAILKESFTATVRAVLGGSPGDALLFYLDFSSSGDPAELVEKMRDVIGSGSPVIERLILKDLYDRLMLPYAERANPEFIAEVESARARHARGGARRG